jgi:hypothetical protein
VQCFVFIEAGENDEVFLEALEIRPCVDNVLREVHKDGEQFGWRF